MLFGDEARAAAAAAAVTAAATVLAMRLISTAASVLIRVVLRGRDCDEIDSATDGSDGDTDSEGGTNSDVMTIDNDRDTKSDGDTSSDTDTHSDASAGNDDVNWYRRYVNTLNPIEIALSYEYWQEVEDHQDILTGHAIIMREPRGTWFSPLDECGKNVSRLREDNLFIAAMNFARFLAAAQREEVEATFADRLRLVQLACLRRAVHCYSPVPGAAHELYCFLVEQGEDLPGILRLQRDLGQLLKLRPRSPTPITFLEMFLDNALHHDELTEDQALHIRKRAADAAWRLTTNGWLATMGASRLAQVSLMWVERELVQAGSAPPVSG